MILLEKGREKKRGPFIYFPFIRGLYAVFFIIMLCIRNMMHFS